MALSVSWNIVSPQAEFNKFVKVSEFYTYGFIWCDLRVTWNMRSWAGLTE